MTFPDWWTEAWYKIKLGVPITKVAAEVGVSRQTVHTYINRQKEKDKTMKDTNKEGPRSTTETGPQTLTLTNVNRDCTSEGGA